MRFRAAGDFRPSVEVSDQSLAFLSNGEEQLLELGGRLGRAEQIALHFGAAEGAVRSEDASSPEAVG
jgi:hypothetical protein